MIIIVIVIVIIIIIIILIINNNYNNNNNKHDAIKLKMYMVEQFKLQFLDMVVISDPTKQHLHEYIYIS